MVKKNKTEIVENDLYILPSAMDDMKIFIDKFKIDMMQNVISQIKFAVENDLKIIGVFQFSDSSFVITLAENEFMSNVEHIHKFYKDNEIYELCPNVEKLFQILKNKKNEKKTPGSI